MTANPRDPFSQAPVNNGSSGGRSPFIPHAHVETSEALGAGLGLDAALGRGQAVGHGLDARLQAGRGLAT
ncbi:unnamed protein product [Urochloa humidicola]